MTCRIYSIYNDSPLLFINIIDIIQKTSPLKYEIMYEELKLNVFSLIYY